MFSNEQVVLAMTRDWKRAQLLKRKMGSHQKQLYSLLPSLCHVVSLSSVTWKYSWPWESENILIIISTLHKYIETKFSWKISFSTRYRSENRMRRHSARSDIRETKTRKNEWRITKMVLVIFLSFVACYLPITIVKIADKCVNFPGKLFIPFKMILSQYYCVSSVIVLICLQSRM